MNARAQLIATRLEKIKKEIGGAQLVAVSKYFSVLDILDAYQAGHYAFGESRLQELKQKAQQLHDKNIEWHFIGHLQRNKIVQLLKISNLKYIHSVDSLKLLEALYQKADGVLENDVYYFLQVNISREQEKQGLMLDESFMPFAEVINKNSSSRLKFWGLMGMGRIRTEDFEGDARRDFQNLRLLRDEIERQYGFAALKLSMGMSQDYIAALSQGSDFVRIGSAIFEN